MSEIDELEGVGERRLTDLEEGFAWHRARVTTDEEAARLAGYAHPESVASRIAARPEVIARLAELRRGREERLRIDADWVLEKLVANYNKAVQAVPVVDKRGNETGKYTYEGHVANRALELIGKIQGIIVDKRQVGIGGTGKPITIRLVRVVRKEIGDTIVEEIVGDTEDVGELAALPPGCLDAEVMEPDDSEG